MHVTDQSCLQVIDKVSGQEVAVMLVEDLRQAVAQFDAAVALLQQTEFESMRRWTAAADETPAPFAVKTPK